jgi:predicted DNA-binding transcriptional regulator AlpA
MTHDTNATGAGAPAMDAAANAGGRLKLWLTPEEAAYALGVSKSSIWVWLRRGLIAAHHPPPVREGTGRGRRLTVIARSEIERFGASYEPARVELEETSGR